MLTSRRDKTSSRRAQTPLMDSSPPSTPKWQPCPSPSPRTRRRFWAKKSRLLKPSSKLLVASRVPLPKLKSLLLPSLPSTTHSRLLMHGRMLPLLSLRTSRKPQEVCSLRTELQGPWISRKTLLPNLKSSRDAQQLKQHFSPRETRCPLMLKSSRTNSPGSPSLSLNSSLTQRLNVTNTPMMSSSGLSTELVSRNSPHGWLELRRLHLRALPSQQISLKSRLLNEKVLGFDKNCVNYLKVLTAAQGAAQKMTTHAEADSEVAGLKGRFDAVKGIADTWVKKCDVLVKEWVLLDNTATELNSWVAKDKSAEGENQFSLEKMESTLGELKNIFKQKEKLVEGL